MKITKKFLIKEYIIIKKNTYKIAEEVGCSRSNICYYLRKYNIGKGIKTRVTKYSKILTKDFLIQQYLKNMKSLPFIANLVGSHPSNIFCYLKKFKIPRRTISEANKLSKRRKGIYRKINAKTRKTYYCIELNCNNEITYYNFKYGTGRCRSCASKKNWKNPEFNRKTRQAILKSCYKKPNKVEKLLNKILNKLFSKEYKFVGDGEIILGGFNPDFININGQKKIIELYGDYWHNLPEYKERDKRRIITYKREGYKTLIIWEHEFKNQIKIVDKIKEFNNA